jgi:DNA polymerase-3 subunit gamma/tau
MIKFQQKKITEEQTEDHSKKVEAIEKDKMDKQLMANKKWSEDLVWSDLIEELNLSGLAKMLANNCALLGRKENTIYLSLDEKSSSYKNLEREQLLSKSLSDFFDEDLTIKVEISKADKETPSQEKIRQKDEQLEAARNNLKSNSGVKEAEELFGASMDPESIMLKN